MPADPSSYYRAPWQPSRLHRNGAARGEARSSGPSTAGSIAARGCSSACRSSLLAFSVARPAALQAPNLPSAFDKDAAAALAADLASTAPERLPGTPGATSAARWFRDQLQQYGITVRTEAFSATCRGAAASASSNLLASKAGLSQKTILVLAHRDDSGAGPGANDNASGTAALIELARAYSPSTNAARVHLPYSLVFLSTDGAVYGGLGAAWFAAHAPEARDVIAVVNLDAIARPEAAATRAERGHAALADARPGRDGPRPARRRDRRHRSAAHQHATAARRPRLPVQPLRAGAVRDPRDPGGDDHDGGRPARSGLGDTSARLRSTRLGQVGRATQNVIDALQEGVALAPGPSSYIYLGSRIVRGWAVELVLVGALLPFLAATVDLFARCRRRRIRVAPALRSYRSRLGFWLWCGALFGLFAAARRLARRLRRGRRRSTASAGRWAASSRSPCSPASAGSSRATGCCRAAPCAPEEELAGHAAALLALSVVALLTVATNPFALIFLLPSLHVWLWLPQVRESTALGPCGRSRRRLCRPPADPLVVRRPIRARLGRAVVHRLALCARVRAAARLRDRPGLRRSGGTARRARRRPVRALSERGRAAASRPPPATSGRLVLSQRRRRRLASELQRRALQG